MNHRLTILAAVLLAACGQQQDPAPAADAKAATGDAIEAVVQSLNAEDLMQHVQVLASDEYEGRMPGTEGGRKTVAYLTEQFKAMGLQPGNPDGTYVQAVPLAGITGTPQGHFTVGKKRIPLDMPNNAVAVTSHFEPSVSVQDSDIVFVGYGVQAPEYGWDDYAGLDVKGKTLVMLVNDPPVQGADGQLDNSLFGGKAMTYYGRWTYKYEIASQLGAAAAIVVHQTKPAGYPWEVVSKGWSGEQFVTKNAQNNTDRVPVESWISLDMARTLFEAAGHDFTELSAAAAKPGFKPVPLKAKATFRIDNSLRTVDSHNVIARLPGSDPKLRDEHIVMTAHWDHLGNDGRTDGDGIYNGALDNATGTAGLLELAEGFAQMETAPPRSLLFLAVTAEEQGLIGSRHYAQTPLWPLEKTVANINMDGLNVWGPTSDVVVVGYGQSTLEDDLAVFVKQQGREIKPDPNSEKGYYYRSDHFEFAKVGVPALYAESGNQLRDQPPGTGEARAAEYVANDYHKPSDEIREDWDLSGAIEDLQLYARIAWRVAHAQQWPQWKEGSEFKAVREAQLKGE